MHTPTPTRHLGVTAGPARFLQPGLIVTVGVAACAPVEPAPATDDELLHAWWDTFHSGEAERLSTLADDSWPVVQDRELRADGVQGRQSRLDADQQAMVDLRAPPGDDGSWTLPDVANAAPIYLIKRYDCAIEQLARILSEPDQLSLYDDYETYARTYTEGSVDGFRNEADDTLAWTVELSADYAGLIKYSQVLEGRMRRIPLSDDGPWTGAYGLVTRTFIPWPADFEADRNRFEQDYQLEVYLPDADGSIVHLYGVWRENQLLGQTLEGDGLANLMLNGLSDWDDTTEAHCAAGRP